jgi:hypothetical protein
MNCCIAGVDVPHRYFALILEKVEFGAVVHILVWKYVVSTQKFHGTLMLGWQYSEAHCPFHVVLAAGCQLVEMRSQFREVGHFAN